MAKSSAVSMYDDIGKRKTAIARVRMQPGNGVITINDRTIDNYFGRPVLRMIVNQPIELVEAQNKFDVNVNVIGGGLSGQAEAIRHGITNALLLIDAKWRKKLKAAGYITRDDRIKERKKYGQRGARARFQFSKR